MTISGTNVKLGETATFTVGSGDPNGVDHIIVTYQGATSGQQTVYGQYGSIYVAIPKETYFAQIQVAAQAYSGTVARDNAEQSFYL